MAVILLLSPATTRSLSSPPCLLLSLSPPPQTLELLEMEAQWWHKFCNLQNKTFFFFFLVLSPPHPRVSTISHSSGQQSWKIWIPALFCSLACSSLFLSPHLKATPYTASSQGWAFPVLIQNQHQETCRKRLPSGLDGSWGGVGEGARVESLL